MVIPEKGEDAAACGSRQAGVREDARYIRKIDEKSRQEKSEESGCAEAGLSAEVSRKNHRAKMMMAQELLQMGFSREAASRILNMPFSHDKTFRAIYLIQPRLQDVV